MESKSIKKIIWAVDAFQTDVDSSSIFSLLRSFSQLTNASIEPVYILSPSSTRIPAGLFPKVTDAFHALAEKTLSGYMEKSEVSNLLNPRILVNPVKAILNDVKALTNYAVETEADVIVVSTHTRKGFSTLVLGSFAETVVLHSQLPVISVNPESKARDRISRVLFPTDFSPRYMEPFEKAVALVKELDAKLILFYKYPIIAKTFIRPEVKDYMDEQARFRAQQSQVWKTWATEYGADVEVRMDSEPGHLSGSIVSYAKEHNVDLIAMATQADPVSAFILGSATRQVVRQSPCPVWTMKVE